MGTERQGHYSKARIFQVSQVIHGISICRLSHTHLCILVLYPVSWGDPGKCIMHTAPSHIQLLLYLSSWPRVFFSSPRDLCLSPFPSLFAHLTTFVIKKSTV